MIGYGGFSSSGKSAFLTFPECGFSVCVSVCVCAYVCTQPPHSFTSKTLLKKVSLVTPTLKVYNHLSDWFIKAVHPYDWVF